MGPLWFCNNKAGCQFHAAKDWDLTYDQMFQPRSQGLFSSLGTRLQIFFNFQKMVDVDCPSGTFECVDFDAEQEAVGSREDLEMSKHAKKYQRLQRMLEKEKLSNFGLIC